MIPTPPLRLPNAGDPWYSSVDHDVEGSLSKLSGTSPSFSGSPSPCGSKTSASTMAIGAPGWGGLLELCAAELAAQDEPAGGVEPGTSSTELATVSTLVPIHQARAMTTANARTE